ncbi:hypothetical protein PFISCL1PPCAC_1828, partial [Pristionchus fissidentatus]
HQQLSLSYLLISPLHNLSSSLRLSRGLRGHSSLLHSHSNCLRCRLVHHECASHLIVHPHGSSMVVELSTVVRGREESHETTRGEELVTILHHLMSAGNQIDTERLAHGHHYILSEDIRGSTSVCLPSLDPRIGIRPEEIDAHRGIGRVLGTRHVPQLIKRVELGRETSVHRQDTTSSQGSQGHPVEGIVENLPEAGALVSPITLFIEAVDTVDGGTLVVTTEHEEVLGSLDLVAEHEDDGLNVLSSSVHVVSQEEIVGIGRESFLVEDTKEIRILSVDISAHDHRGIDLDEGGLTGEDSLHRRTAHDEVLLRDLMGESSSWSSDIEDPP